MTLPGLALVYGGLVASKSVLSVVIQCFAISALASVIWLSVGYSLAFGESLFWFIGTLENAFFLGIAPETVHPETPNLPEMVFVIFQMTFAMIAPAIISGAYAERMKFPVALVFSGLWSLLVYIPICHWVWGGGWLEQMGAMDFAGGLVLHANVGAAALVASIIVAGAWGFPTRLRRPTTRG